MKCILIAIGMLLVSTNALPQQLANLETEPVKIGQRDPIVELIQSVLDALSQLMVEAGFDPLVITAVDEQVSLFDVVDLRLLVSNLRVEGISNIALDMEIGNSINLDISLPAIRITVDQIRAEVNILGGVFAIDLETSGSLAIVNPGIVGSLGINLGVDGLGLTDVQFHIKLDDIQSDGRTVVMGQDVSDAVNNFINITIPQLLRVYGDQIDEVLAALVNAIFDLILGILGV